MAVIGMMTVAQAQLSLEAPYRSTGKAMMDVFEPQRAIIQTSSAVIMDGRDESGYGVIISADGYILTKASEFEALKEPQVLIDRKRYKEVEVIASDSSWDVVLIKVDANDLIPVVYADSSDAPTGTWVVGNGATSMFKRRILMGIVAANSREVPAEGGLAIGVLVKSEGDHLKVEKVDPKGGAHEAGIKEGDLILKVEGKPVKKVEDIVEALVDKEVGDKAEFTYRRDGKESKMMVELKIKGSQMSRNDMMSGNFSKRRSGFPRVLQHTILGARNTVGGPLLNLDGECIGMNIARANRAESFAIPVENLKEIAERLMKQAKE